MTCGDLGQTFRKYVKFAVGKFGRALASQISACCPSAIAPERSGELRATGIFLLSSYITLKECLKNFEEF